MNPRAFVLASLASMLIFGGALAVLRPSTGESEDANPAYWIDKLNAPRGAFDIVILGDSRAYRGIDPSRLPGKTLNFGFSGASLRSPFYLLEGIQKVKPKGTIVVAITPHALSSRALESNAFDALYHRHRADLVVSRTFAPLYPLTRPYTMAQMVSLAKGKVKLLAPVSPSESYSPGGWVASSRPAVQVAKATSKTYEEMLRNHPVGKLELEDFLFEISWYSASGYRVVFLRLPTSTDVKQAENFDDADLRKRVVELRMEWFDVPPGETYDGSHLTRASAENISDALGRYLAN